MIDVDTHIIDMSNEKKYTIDLSNIKYCTITIIYNESEDIFVKASRFFNWSGENKIILTDTIILEHENETIELDLNPNYSNNKIIEYKYYSYGVSPEIFPKSIIKEKINTKKFYLSFIEPELIANQYKNKYSGQIFRNYPQKQKYHESYYCSTYGNIYNDKIAFGISKISYTSNKSSRYIVGYDSTILDFEDVKSIIKEIFIKNNI